MTLVFIYCIHLTNGCTKHEQNDLSFQSSIGLKKKKKKNQLSRQTLLSKMIAKEQEFTLPVSS